MIRYWIRSLLGMAIALASILAMTWALYHLVRTGTCASGGPYVSARPCPAGTGTKILALIGSFFTLGIGALVYATRGNRGYGASLGMGVVLWALLFISLAAATFVAAFGPANNDDPGARTAAIVLAVVFLPMALIPLVGAVGFGLGGKRVKRRLGFEGDEGPRRYPTPAPPQMPVIPPPAPARPSPAAATTSTPASNDDPVGRLRKLDELRDAGLLTDEEFDAKKAEILREM